jgi:hypothetical protein
MLSCRYHKLSTSSGREGSYVPVRIDRQARVIFPLRLLAVSF